MRLSSKQNDRAVGALLGAAAGDALGVPYEYGSRRLDGRTSASRPGGCCRRPRARPVRWPRCCGGSRLGTELHAETGRTAGNGSLMRTSPVALAHLGDPPAIAEAARAVSALTHHDPVAGEACVLWCLAIDHAVRTGELNLCIGLAHVSEMWPALLDEAETVDPSYYAASNGWVVAALLGAYAAVHSATSLPDGLQRAVAGGGDTDTVAAIAGALLGARYGGSAVPFGWRRLLHGWPGLRSRDLDGLAVLTVRGGRVDPQGDPERLA